MTTGNMIFETFLLLPSLINIYIYIYIFHQDLTKKSFLNIALLFEKGKRCGTFNNPAASGCHGEDAARVIPK